MFQTLKYTSPLFKHSVSFKSGSLGLSTSCQKSFSYFLQENPKRRSSKKSLNKKLFYAKAWKAFGQGFLKGPDFYAVEQSIAFREANELHLKAQEHRRCKDYGKALVYYNMVFSAIKEYTDGNDVQFAYYFQKVAEIYVEREDYQNAIMNWEYASEALMEAYGEEDFRLAPIFLSIGQYQMKERNYVEAVQNVHDALQIYNKSPDRFKNEIASCHSKLAKSFLYIGKYEEALENFERLLEKNNQEAASTIVSHTYENFAIALAYAKHKYDEALLYLQQCLTKEMLLNGGSSLSSGNCYLKIGQINSMQGRYQEALEAYNKALEISKLTGGSHHRQTGSCYNAIGAVFLGQSKYAEAIEYFKLALNCFEEKDFEIYACYKNIAMSCFRQNRFDTALRNLEYSIEERSKLLEWFSQVDAESAALHGFMASLYIRNENYIGCMEHYEQFLETVFKLFCSESLKTCQKKKEEGSHPENSCKEET